jgi:hypothetical protein
MHSLASQLADNFIPHFSSADREITWLAVEEERQLELAPDTILIGKIDARGLTGDGVPFFGDWKTISNSRARYMDEEKVKWRTNPQALTYGVLVPEVKLFLVRWAIKPPKRGGPAGADFEWYTYTQAEVDHWRSQLIGIADDIRACRRREVIPWRTNFSTCYKYGMAYACPFVDACMNQSWQTPGERKPHSALEAKWLDNRDESLVILSSSRVSDWLDCPESYRSKWEGKGFTEESETLAVGSDFHKLMEGHYGAMIAKERPC